MGSNWPKIGINELLLCLHVDPTLTISQYCIEIDLFWINRVGLIVYFSM